MHEESSYPGELVAIDMYGPLPKCPGGSITLPVALDILSGYIMAIPLKDMKGPSFISATKNIIKKLRQTNVAIQTLLSDNSSQFRSKKYIRFCDEEGI